MNCTSDIISSAVLHFRIFNE